MRSCTRDTVRRGPENLHILGNALDKLDRLAAQYKTTMDPEDLANYLFYRDKFLELHGICWLDSLVDSHTAWMMHCYEAAVLDDLDVFKHKAVPQPDFVEKIKAWREEIRAKSGGI